MSRTIYYYLFFAWSAAMKWEIIKKFSVRGKTCFCYADVLAEFPDKDRSHLSKVLSSMVNMGILTKSYLDLFLSNILELEWTAESQRMLNVSVQAFH